MNVRRKNFLLTGLPGTGKTTLIRKVSGKLESLHPVGFFTSEIREENVRKGFELVSLDGKRGLLAHVNLRSPHRVGRYKVNVKGFEAFLDAVPFLDPSVRLVIFDEIGKMECFSESFKRRVISVLDSDKLLIATIAFKGNDFVEGIKRREDVQLIELLEGNREALVEEIGTKVRTLYAQREN
jgi:nucleoside-triphosphatase